MNLQIQVSPAVYDSINLALAMVHGGSPPEGEAVNTVEQQIVENVVAFVDKHCHDPVWLAAERVHNMTGFVIRNDDGDPAVSQSIRVVFSPFNTAFVFLPSEIEVDNLYESRKVISESKLEYAVLEGNEAEPVDNQDTPSSEQGEV